MKKTKKLLTARILAFCIILIGIFMLVSHIVQPVWFEWNNYDTTHAFYKEPKNTIETVFLGASVTVNGIIPTQLYEEQGICAYNLGTEQQPMLASYYWLKEAYRLQSGTLKTVVLDISQLRWKSNDNFLRKALDNMHLSTVKLEAIKDYTTGFKNFMTYLFPVISYHDRWKNLDETDFTELTYKVPLYMRGYNFVTTKQSDTIKNIIQPAHTLSDTQERTEFNAQSLHYLDQMYQFCKEHDLQFVLIKTPVARKGSKRNWTDSDHISMQELADNYGVEFLDFNYTPLLDQLDYVHDTDSTDGIHLNYYGAQKLTSWFGKYLIEQCNNTDVREDESYSFMDTELADYQNERAKRLADAEQNISESTKE